MVKHSILCLTSILDTSYSSIIIKTQNKNKNTMEEKWIITNQT